MAAARKKVRRERPVPLIMSALAMVSLVLLLAPVVVVILAGLNSGDHLTFPPDGLSLRWVVAFFQSGAFLPAYLFSLVLAVCTMFFSTILGTTIALVLARNEFPGKQMARAFFMAPLMLPGIVLGLALYLFYLSSGLGLIRTMPGLVIGHVLVTCPYVIGTVNASLVGFDKSFEEAARSLGAGPLKTFRVITLPIISSGIIAGSVFSFIVSFGQFDISLFLTPPDYNPLPIALYSSLRYTFEPTAAAAGIFAIFLVVVSMLITARFTNLRKLANVNFS
ncbi:ABC transporter permease [Paracoccaceae bacterium]|nr:ABC transporter permease [Paracoccaceae bacterium]